MVEEQKVKVWDIGVRLFHWSLVVLFFLAYLSGDDDSTVHIVAGYGVLALIAFRIVWGFVGTRHARFSDFIFGPVLTMKYARSLFSRAPLRYLGHNPLGGWMVVALLVALLGACWSGLEAYGTQGHGPLAGNESRMIASAMANDDDRERRAEGKTEKRESEGDEFWEEIHEAFSNLALFLVFLHIVGVLFADAVHREKLIKAMITGFKTRRGD